MSSSESVAKLNNFVPKPSHLLANNSLTLIIANINLCTRLAWLVSKMAPNTTSHYSNSSVDTPS
jgi:hypothetical protein